VLESDAFTYDGRLIWGLSLMMIDELLEIIGGRAAVRDSTAGRLLGPSVGFLFRFNGW
jgi:hypothetical protein